MEYYLVCVHAFANYERGNVVRDPEEIARLIADDREHNFVRVSAPPDASQK